MQIREDMGKHMSELKAWLEETADVPLEGMADFFAARVEGYEEHMGIWEQAYIRMADYVESGTKRILDLGCGTGLELDRIYERYPKLEVTGIDLTEAMLSVLADKHADKCADGRLKLICADYFVYPYEQECYDMVISVESLHHFKPAKKRELFQKIYAALPEGGVFVNADYLACCEEEESVLFAVCDRKKAEAGIPEEQFVHFDTPLTLEHEMELLREVGFTQVVATESINGATFVRAIR